MHYDLRSLMRRMSNNYELPQIPTIHYLSVTFYHFFLSFFLKNRKNMRIFSVKCLTLQHKTKKSDMNSYIRSYFYSYFNFYFSR